MPRIQFNMRIEEDIKQGLDDAAKKQNRTTANLIEWLFKQYLSQVATYKSTTTVEPDFAAMNNLNDSLMKRRPAIAETLHYLEDK